MKTILKVFVAITAAASLNIAHAGDDPLIGHTGAPAQRSQTEISIDDEINAGDIDLDRADVSTILAAVEENATGVQAITTREALCDKLKECSKLNWPQRDTFKARLYQIIHQKDDAQRKSEITILLARIHITATEQAQEDYLIYIKEKFNSNTYWTWSRTRYECLHLLGLSLSVIPPVLAGFSKLSREYALASALVDTSYLAVPMLLWQVKLQQYTASLPQCVALMLAAFIVSETVMAWLYFGYEDYPHKENFRYANVGLSTAVSIIPALMFGYFAFVAPVLDLYEKASNPSRRMPLY